MLIKINGKPEEVKKQLNLAELVLSRGLCTEHIVVEHNYCIISKPEWKNVLLGENDIIEIISFVGGG